MKILNNLNISARKLFIILSLLITLILHLLTYEYPFNADEGYQVPYSEQVLDYYSSLGEDSAALYNKNGIHYYGGLYEIIPAFLNNALGYEPDELNYFKVRRIIIALMGALAMIFTGLIAKEIGGWGVANLSLIFIFLSPRFFGHSLINPKDIPFALGYMISIFFIIKVITHMPKYSWKLSLGLAIGFGIAFGVRAGGLIVVPYILLFSGLNYLYLLKKKLVAFDIQSIMPLVYTLITGLGVGYLIGILFWPFGLIDPIHHPLEALTKFTNFSINIKQLFEGEHISSNILPWYYPIKYILISTPEIILLGFFLSIILSWKLFLKHDFRLIFILFFAFFFPILYILYKNSNVYGGLRHILFTLPPLAIISGLGWHLVISTANNKFVKIILSALVIILFFRPVTWLIKSHPHQYIYFNDLSGGIKKALGKYELDYWMTSADDASKWLIKNEPINGNTKIMSASTYICTVPFHTLKEEVKSLEYTRYYERGEKDWDYGIFVNVYIDAYQLQKKIWPPKGTIHTVNINGVPLCAIIKRENKSDYYGYEALKQNNFFEAIKSFKDALNYDPKNEGAWLGLANAYLSVGDINNAEQAIYKSLESYPTYLSALNVLGNIFLRRNDFNSAILTYDKMLEVQPSYAGAYYYRGLCYANTNNVQQAVNDLTMAAGYNPSLKKEAFTQIANIYNKTGNTEMARRYAEEANK